MQCDVSTVTTLYTECSKRTTSRGEYIVCCCVLLESIAFLTYSQKDYGHQDLQTSAYQISFYWDLKNTQFIEITLMY
jgi:hypothetical protein